MVATVSLHHLDEKARLATKRARRSKSEEAAGEAHDEIVTTVQVDYGWHVNANPASFDYLFPTAVAFEGLSHARITYPPAVRIHPRFAPDGLDVRNLSTRMRQRVREFTVVPASSPAARMSLVERIRLS